MSNLTERYEKERQMETDIRIQQLRVKRLEHQMAYELDPFGPEFDEAAEKLRKLKAALHAAGVKKSNYHYETAHLAHEAAQKKQDAENAQKEADWRKKHPKLATIADAKGNQPEI